MEVIFILLPLAIGPFLFAIGAVQLLLARITEVRTDLPVAHVVTGLPLEDEEGSWRQRGKRNLFYGVFLTAFLVAVAASLLEAAN